MSSATPAAKRASQPAASAGASASQPPSGAHAAAPLSRYTASRLSSIDCRERQRYNSE